MKKLMLSLTVSFGLSLFAGLGVTALGMIVAPSNADAYCRTYWRRTWRCHYRYGERVCNWYTRRTTSCNSNCVWRRYQKRYCYRTAGYYTPYRYCYQTSYYSSYEGRVWRRTCVWRKRYVPGRYTCSYRWATRKVCY